MTTARVWVPDRDWRVLPEGTGRLCRLIAGHPTRACREPAVAELQRTRWIRGQSRKVWWAYCSQHLYGHRLENGVVLCEVAADSPAAKEGYV